MPSSLEEKNIEDEILCSYVPTCDHPLGVGPILTPGASSKQTWYRSTRRCYIPNMKALALTVWDKKIFKNFLLSLYAKSENPPLRTNFLLQGHNLKSFGRRPLDDATSQI